MLDWGQTGHPMARQGMSSRRYCSRTMRDVVPRSVILVKIRSTFSILRFPKGKRKKRERIEKEIEGKTEDF